MPINNIVEATKKYFAIQSHILWPAILRVVTPFVFILEILIGIVLAYYLLPVIISMIFKIIYRKRAGKQEEALLELTFPSDASKSAFSTEQLYILLHTKSKQHGFVDRMLRQKKRYSFELVSTKEDGIRYLFALPKCESAGLQRSLLSYLPGIKIREVEDYLSPEINRPTRIVELKLSADFVLPLESQKALDEHDAISYLTGHMTKLAPDELIAFQIIISPVLPSTHRGIVRRTKALMNQIYLGQNFSSALNPPPQSLVVLVTYVVKPIGWLINQIMTLVISLPMLLLETKTDNIPLFKRELTETVKVPLSPHELELGSIIKGKLDQHLFETTLRLLVVAANEEALDGRTEELISTFRAFTTPYQSIVTRSRLFLSSQKRLIGNFQNRELSSSLFGLNPILSNSELADLYHFPHTNTSQTEDLINSKSRDLPAPLSFKQSATQLDNVFATNYFSSSETPIGQTLDERRRHTYIIGATGSGKTTLLSTMIYNDILCGKGVAVIDPHGQLIERLLEVIPKNRIKDVVWFAPDDDEYPVALNLLELKNDGTLTNSQLQKQKSLVASSLVSVIQKLYDERYFGPRMEYVLKNAIYTALETPTPTLKTILDLLTKTAYRKEVVKGLTNEVLRDFWTDEFNKLGEMQRNSVISPITNKIGGLLSSPINYRILTAEKSTIDFDNILSSGKILLCDLSKGKIGEDESSFFGSLVIAKIQLAALARARMAEADRQDFFLYVDEFQNFATKSFSELVSEARKYHVATILAHQSISQIEDRDIIKTMLANVGTVICFRTANPEDEQFILPIFSPEVEKHDISNLPLYNFYMKISVGKAQDAFLAKTNNFTIDGSGKTAQTAIEASRIKYATPDEKPAIATKNKEKGVRQMRQKLMPKVSHSTKMNETKNQPISGSKSENFGVIPLQGGSKVGNGKVSNKQKNNNKNKQYKINTTNPKPQHQLKQTTTQKPSETLTIKQQQIVLLLYKFRFLDRIQIQKYLAHKNHKRILVWLNELIDKKFLKTVDNNSKTKIYYLAQNGIKFLSSQESIDKSALEKCYHEKDRTAAFVGASLLLADIYLDLQEKTGYKMWVKSDYPEYEFADLLGDLSPHAYIEQRKSGKTKRWFLEILADVPEKWLRLRLKKYLNFYQGSEWETETGKDFPIALIICSNDSVSAYAKRYLKTKLKSLDDPDLKINLTTIESVKQSGLAGDIWTRLT